VKNNKKLASLLTVTLIIAMMFSGAIYADDIKTTDTVTVDEVTAEDPADLQVNKTFLNETWDPDWSANQGDFVYSLINVQNLGPDPAEDVIVTDVVTAGLAFINYYTSYDNGATWFYNDGTYDANTGIWNVGNMANGASVFLNILWQVTTNHTVEENTATATSSTPDPKPDNNQATAKLITVSPAVDVAINKTFLDAYWNPTETALTGDFVYILLSVTNNGPDTATSNVGLYGGPFFYDYFPANLLKVGTYYTSYDGGLTWNTNDGSWDIYYDGNAWDVPPMTPGDLFYLAILAQVAGYDDIYNEASVTSQLDQWDWNQTNNQDSAILDVLSADLDIEKTYEDLTAPYGTVNYMDYLKFSLEVTNNGPDEALNTVVTDTLNGVFDLDYWEVSWDNGITWITDDPSYDPINGIWNIGTLDANANALLNIYGTVLTVDYWFSNEATVTATNDPTSSTDGFEFYVPPAADLYVEKSFKDWTAPFDQVKKGDIVEFIIEAGNHGPMDGTNVLVTDTFNPDFMDIIAWAISYDGGVTWMEMDPAFDPITGIWTIGTLPYGGAINFYLLSIIGTITVSGTTATEEAVISGDQYDPDLTNNEDSVTIDILSEPKPPEPNGTIPMQPTGAPLAALLLAVLMVFAGFIRRK
jgi:uncharacterized repeat protein (TIGR01451 family)